MNLFLARSIVIVSLALTLSTSLMAQQGQKEGALTNAAVVKLAKAGFKEKTIISIINARIPAFDLSPDRMIDLKRSGVSEKVIVAMLARQEGLDPFDDDTWGEDMSLGSSLELPKGSNQSQTGGTDPGTNIFGSSGGSKGSTRTRAGGAASSGDTVTTGSATVRILRPPTEAGGGGSTKLEKTKTLTNDSIVELVEAGFSEGTIIRRIEQSPVEFDLAVPKVEELRKQRVSDKILAAMKAAMGDETNK